MTDFDIRLVAYTPNGDRIGLLPQPAEFDVSDNLNAVSGASIKYSTLALESERLAGNVEIACEYMWRKEANWVEMPNGRYLLIRAENDATDEGGVWTYTLPGYASQFTKTQVSVTVSQNNSDGRREFIDLSPGRVLKTLIDEAKARGTLPALTYDFTLTEDSNGEKWEDDYLGTFVPGSTFLDVLDHMVENGYIDWRMQGRKLQVYNAAGEMSAPRANRRYIAEATVLNVSGFFNDAASSLDSTDANATSGANPWHGQNVLDLMTRSAPWRGVSETRGTYGYEFLQGSGKAIWKQSAETQPDGNRYSWGSYIASTGQAPRLGIVCPNLSNGRIDQTAMKVLNDRDGVGVLLTGSTAAVNPLSKSTRGLFKAAAYMANKKLAMIELTTMPDATVPYNAVILPTRGGTIGKHNDLSTLVMNRLRSAYGWTILEDLPATYKDTTYVGPVVRADEVTLANAEKVLRTEAKRKGQIRYTTATPLPDFRLAQNIWLGSSSGSGPAQAWVNGAWVPILAPAAVAAANAVRTAYANLQAHRTSHARTATLEWGLNRDHLVEHVAGLGRFFRLHVSQGFAANSTRRDQLALAIEYAMDNLALHRVPISGRRPSNPSDYNVPEELEGVELKLGRDLEEAPTTYDRSGMVSRVYGYGDSWSKTMVENLDHDNPWGNWEASVAAGGVSDQDTLRKEAFRLLNEGNSVREENTRKLIFDNSPFLPYQHYGVGDFIRSDTVAGYGEAYRVHQLVLSKNAEGNVFGSIKFGDRFIAPAIAQQRQITAARSATAAGKVAGTGLQPSHPVTDTRKPARPVITTTVTSKTVNVLGVDAGRATVAFTVEPLDDEGNDLPLQHLSIERVLEVGTDKTEVITTLPITDEVLAAGGGEVTFDVPLDDPTEIVVRAVARTGVISEMSQSTAFIIDTDVTPPGQPKQPGLDGSMSGLTVKWDGLVVGNLAQPDDYAGTAVYLSNVSGFTESEATLVGRYKGAFEVTYWDRPAGTYYVKLVSYDVRGNLSPASVQASVVLEPLVIIDSMIDTINGAKIVNGTIVASDKIVANSITAAQIAALTITAGQLAANSITGSKIIAGAIDGKLITGATLQTAASGDRFVIDSTAIKGYYSSQTVFDYTASTGKLTLRNTAGATFVEADPTTSKFIAVGSLQTDFSSAALRAELSSVTQIGVPIAAQGAIPAHQETVQRQGLTMYASGWASPGLVAQVTRTHTTGPSTGSVSSAVEISAGTAVLNAPKWVLSVKEDELQWGRQFLATGGTNLYGSGFRSGSTDVYLAAVDSDSVTAWTGARQIMNPTMFQLAYIKRSPYSQGVIQLDADRTLVSHSLEVGVSANTRFIMDAPRHDFGDGVTGGAPARLSIIPTFSGSTIAGQIGTLDITSIGAMNLNNSNSVRLQYGGGDRLVVGAAGGIVNGTFQCRVLGSTTTRGTIEGTSSGDLTLSGTVTTRVQVNGADRLVGYSDGVIVNGSLLFRQVGATTTRGSLDSNTSGDIIINPNAAVRMTATKHFLNKGTPGSPTAIDATAGGVAMRIGSDGQMYQQSSLSRNKLNQKPLGVHYELLELQGKTYYDRAMTENPNEEARILSGFIAEEVQELSQKNDGLFDPFLQFDANGELSGLDRENMIPFMIHVMRDMNQRLLRAESALANK